MMELTTGQCASIVILAACVVVFAAWVRRLLLTPGPAPKPEIVKPSRPPVSLNTSSRWDGDGWRTGR